MAVTYLGEIPGGRDATNSEGSRSYTRSFRLVTSATSDDAYDVGSNASLPGMGQAHPDDPLATVKEISVKNSDPWRGWTVTVKYDDKRDLDEDDPENDEVLISSSSEAYEQTFIREEGTNFAVLNSAGDFFTDPVPTREITHLNFKIQANYQTAPAWIQTHENAINDSTITILGHTFPEAHAKVGRIDVGNREKRSTSTVTITYRPVTVDIHTSSLSFDLQLLDQGFRERAADNELKQVKNDGDHAEPTTQILLDGMGKRLDDPTPQTAVFLTFEVYNRRNFALLPGIT